MRRGGACTLVLQLCTSTVLAAQATGVGAATENSHTLHVTVGLVIPALSQMQRSSTPRVIAKRAQFSEYVLILAVSSNTPWELIAQTLPRGVAIRDERGDWSTADSSGATVARGRPAHFFEVLLLVRVWRDADPDWESRLQLRVKTAVESYALVVN
jgi:hypothetical protein